MTPWRDNGPVIIPRELRRRARGRTLPGGPLSIISMLGNRYRVHYGGMDISFRDGRGLIAGLMVPVVGAKSRSGASPYRDGPNQDFELYREQRVRAMMEEAVHSYSLRVEFDATYDLRAFLLFGSYRRAIANVLTLATLPKPVADSLQREYGYVRLDGRDDLAAMFDESGPSPSA